MFNLLALFSSTNSSPLATYPLYSPPSATCQVLFGPLCNRTLSPCFRSSAKASSSSGDTTAGTLGCFVSIPRVLPIMNRKTVHNCTPDLPCLPSQAGLHDDTMDGRYFGRLING